jgi:hypothetical protein
MEKVKPIKVERVAPRVPQVGKLSGSKKSNAPERFATSVDKLPTEFTMVPTEKSETREIIEAAKVAEEASKEKVAVVKKKRVAKTKSTTIAKLDGASVTAEAIGKLVSDLPAGDGIKYKIVAIKPI